MRLGGPIFLETTDPALLVREHQRLGLSAAYCPEIADVVLREDTQQAFAAADIVLAEVGAYCINILDTDATRRRQNIETICRRLAYAEEMGARCCVIHGGSVATGADSWSAVNPENISPRTFDDTVRGVQAIIDAVQPRRAQLTLEMTAWLFPYNAQTYADLFAAVDRPAFGVHLDPVNILDSPIACLRNTEILQDCFAQLGPNIVSCHSKDVLIKGVYEPIHICETYPGEGLLDYHTYLRELSRLPQEPPLMIEHLGPEQLPAAIAHVVGVATEIGVTFRQATHV